MYASYFDDYIINIESKHGRYASVYLVRLRVYQGVYGERKYMEREKSETRKKSKKCRWVGTSNRAILHIQVSISTVTIDSSNNAVKSYGNRPSL
jgi:hypothetical protein